MNDPRHPRAVNEWLSASSPSDDVLDLMCECGTAACRSFFQITASRYGRARGRPDRRLVVPEHLDDAEFEVIRRWPDVVLVRMREAAPVQR
jgi:hypothetical protein